MKHPKVMKIDVRSEDSGHGEGRRYLKQRTNRLMRRMARQVLDDAPTSIRQITRGWVS